MPCRVLTLTLWISLRYLKPGSGMWNFRKIAVMRHSLVVSVTIHKFQWRITGTMVPVSIHIADHFLEA